MGYRGQTQVKDRNRLCRDTLPEWQPRTYLEEAWGCKTGKVPMFGKYRRRGVGPP